MRADHLGIFLCSPRICDDHLSPFLTSLDKVVRVRHELQDAFQQFTPAPHGDPRAGLF